MFSLKHATHFSVDHSMDSFHCSPVPHVGERTIQEICQERPSVFRFLRVLRYAEVSEEIGNTILICLAGKARDKTVFPASIGFIAVETIISVKIISVPFSDKNKGQELI